MDILIFILKL